MSKYTDRIDQRFPYTTAAETAKPGYLAKRFATIIKEKAEAKAAREAEEAAAKDEAESIEQKVQRKIRRMK